MASPPLIAVGRVTRAHGVRGRVVVVPYNADSEGLERVSAFWLRRGEEIPRRLEVAGVSRAQQGYLVAFRGVEDRDAAAAFGGCEALIERAELPAPEPGEIYAVDLVGMEVADALGERRGVVVGIESAGPNELLEIEAEGRRALVPLGLVLQVDEEARRLIIEAPEGLFELEK